jgi:ATP-dependent protease HslVU (ClpYQ) peptidase subunit
VTVVAGYVDRESGRVHLAADSAAVAGDGLVLRKDKIHHLPMGVADRAVIGCAGFSALGHLLQRHLKLDAAPDGDADGHAWAQATAEAITEIALEHHLVDPDDAGRADLACLLAWHGQMWTVSHDLAVPVERYHAVGHGAAVAMGAMWACDQVQRAQPSEIPGLAVAAAIEHMDGISGPVTTASTREA